MERAPMVNGKGRVKREEVHEEGGVVFLQVPSSTTEEEGVGAATHARDASPQQPRGSPSPPPPSPPHRVGVDAMRCTVSKTLPHPLGGPARREFKKALSKPQSSSHPPTGDQVGGIFGIIDQEVMGIHGMLSGLVEVVYDSYTKAIKRIEEARASQQQAPAPQHQQPRSDATSTTQLASDPNALARAMSEAQRSIADLKHLQDKHQLLCASFERHRDLFCQLHSASAAAVESVPHQHRTEQVRQLACILESCSQERMEPGRDDVLTREGADRLASEIKSISSALRGYNALQEIVLDMKRAEKKRRVEAQLSSSSPLVSEPVPQRQKRAHRQA